MKSTLLCIRLNPQETEQLDALRAPTQLNRSEAVRKLIIDEYGRTRSGKRPNPNRVLSDMRRGRPRTPTTP